MRVLVVEDKRKLADAVAHGLREAGFAVDVAYDGSAGRELAMVNDYDVVVLDRGLPAIHGDDLCRQLAGGVRILMLTAATSLESRVEGLDLGADDYLGKPFALSELLARLRALCRRSDRAVPPVLRHGDLVLDPAHRQVTRAGDRVELTRKEFGVLHELMVAGGAVVSAETLIERVWDEHADPFSNAVRVVIVNLRRKLGPPPVIATVRGAGYHV